MHDENIYFAHELRKNLARPFQSGFRVVALICCEDAHHQSIKITGTNTETSYIGGSICAERAALCKLNEIRGQIKEIKSVTVVSDAEEPISPGVLCREFLYSHLSSVVPVVMSGSKNENEAVCSTVGDLYPYGYLFRSVPQKSLSEHISNFLQSSEKFEDVFTAKSFHIEVQAFTEALSSTADDKSTVHHMRYAVSIIFDDDSIENAHQLKTAEYGSTLDPVTQLIWLLLKKKENNIKPRRLLQVDQYGILHAPFATARALLFEHGFTDLVCYVHNSEGSICSVRIVDLIPQIASYVSATDIHACNKS